MRISALESPGFALQLSKSRFLNFEIRISKIPNSKFFKFSKKLKREVVEHSLLIPMSKTALLYRQNWPRSVIFEKFEEKKSMSQIKNLSRTNMF